MERDIMLVEAVERYPELYDNRNKGYKNQIAHKNAWRRVATEVNATVKDCELRWKQIRQRFCKIRAKVTRSESPTSSSIGNWCLYDHLHFLQDIVRRRRSKGYLAELSRAEENEGDKLSVDNSILNRPTKVQADESFSETESLCDILGGPVNSTLFAQQERKMVTKSTTSTATPICTNMNGVISNTMDQPLRNKFMEVHQQKEPDGIHLFAMHLAQELRQVPPALRNKCKIELLKVVDQFVQPV